MLIKLRNGVLIPKLGLGTYKMTNEAEIKNVILDAIEVGYRHFDTAQMYGNEAYIGEALKASGLKREEYYLTTKLHNHHSKEETRNKINQSLKDLQTDYLDVLLIHWPNHDDKINQNTWEVFEEYYEKGIVKAIGLSNFSRYQMEKLFENIKIKPFINQIEFHPALSQIQLKKYLDKHNIQLMGYAPLMRGLGNEERYFATFEQVANKHKVSKEEVMIAWGLHKNAILIPKTVTKSRLISNFNTQNIKLDEKDIALIDSLNHGRKLYSDPANNIYGEFIK